MSTDPLDSPIVSPIMVGREAHLDALRRRLDDALAGAGQTVLVSGDAGIGKSRLVREASAHARERGFRVLTGQCFEPDRALPYAPLRDLIRSDLREPWAVEIASEIGVDLGEIVPEIDRRASSEQPGGHRDRHLIVHAFTRLVEQLAAQAPVLLIIEDAHWSDEASLDLLLHVARLLRRERGPAAALVVTYRGDEISPELAAALAAFDRERLAVEVRLAPLPRAEVMAMLHALNDHRPMHAGLVEAIYRLSEGNPFFVEELLRSALTVDAGFSLQRDDTVIPLPRSVAEAVRRRVSNLSDGARETLTVAAVSGRRFDFPLLSALSGCTEAQLVDRIKELIAAKLIVEESADRFAFRHALMREAIDDALLARERRALHRRALEALLQTDPAARDHHAADLVRHAVGAGAWAEALAYGQRAGEQALALHAPNAAIEHLTHALDAAGHLGIPPPPALLGNRGLAHETVGQFEAARADYEAAIALAQRTGSPAEECEGLLALGALWAGRDYGQTAVHVRRALELARAVDDRALTARALNRLANWHANQEEPAEALRLHEVALALMEETGDRRGIAETLDLVGMARLLGGDFVGAASAFRRVIPLLRELDDRHTLVNALSTLSFCTSPINTATGVAASSSYEERLAFVTEATAISRASGARSDEAFASCCTALVLAERRMSAAIETAERARRIAEEIGHRQWETLAHMVRGMIAVVLLDPEAARLHFETALAIAREIDSANWSREALTFLAMLKTDSGDLEGAEAALAQVLDAGTAMLTLDQREAWLTQAEIALARSQPERARAIVDHLIAAATDSPERDRARLPHLVLLRGRCLAALDRPDDALAALTIARDGATDMGNTPLLWRIHLARFALHRSLDHRADAAAELAAAHDAAATYATGIEDAAMRQAFLRRVTARFPPIPTPSARQVARDAYGGLTKREREVAALVAAGHSNRGIGEALFLSERTAATHVGNILGKLGLKTRAQIAAWAQEHSLTAETTGE